MTVGATYFSDPGGGACGNLNDGHFHYAELGTATSSGVGTGEGWIARALGLHGELNCGAGLWIRFRGRTTYATKADRGYGQGGDGYRSDPTYAIDLYVNVADYLGFQSVGRGFVQIAPNFQAGAGAPPGGGGQPGTALSELTGQYNVIYERTNSAGLIDDAWKAVGGHGVRALNNSMTARRLVMATRYVTTQTRAPHT